MKSFIYVFIAISIICVDSFAKDVYEEGEYESGTCSAANVRKGMKAGDKFWESVPFIGKKNQLGCCVASVTKACNESFDEMDVKSHTEIWANCMKSYAFSAKTNQCPSETCKQWAKDCLDVGIGPIRGVISERKEEE